MVSSKDGEKAKGTLAQARDHQLCEPWDRLTLQSLAARAAMEHPARPFLFDCPRREAWNGMEPRALTSDGFVKAATFLAAQFRTLGIARGERVLIVLPNIVEAPITILAAQLAGLVPALIGADETVDALRAAAERSAATLMVTTSHVAEIALAEKVRSVAARAISVRAVAGFGFALPDGVVSLEGWSEEDVVALPEVERRQSDPALITFGRFDGRVTPILRTEGQMVAEALALTSVLRLDGRRGLVSLMHPGAAASVAASLVLPLHAGATVRLVGPYDTAALAAVFMTDPTAFLYCPDHFAARLEPTSLGKDGLRNHAGILALARAQRPDDTIVPQGTLPANLIVDFGELGLMTRLGWPDARLDLPAHYPHPMESILPEGTAMLEWSGDPAGWLGFGAARPLAPPPGSSAGQAA